MHEVSLALGRQSSAVATLLAGWCARNGCLHVSHCSSILWLHPLNPLAYRRVIRSVNAPRHAASSKIHCVLPGYASIFREMTHGASTGKQLHVQVSCAARFMSQAAS